MLPSDHLSARLPFHLHTVNELESVHYDSLLSLDSEKDEQELLSPMIAQRSPTASPPDTKLSKVHHSCVSFFFPHGQSVFLGFLFFFAVSTSWCFFLFVSPLSICSTPRRMLISVHSSCIQNIACFSYLWCLKSFSIQSISLCLFFQWQHFACALHGNSDFTHI
jgi:hypothetical protein